MTHDKKHDVALAITIAAGSATLGPAAIAASFWAEQLGNMAEPPSVIGPALFLSVMAVAALTSAITWLVLSVTLLDD